MNLPSSDALTPVPSGSLTIAPLSTNFLKLSLVIPTYNEGENIQAIIKSLSESLDRAIWGAYELIVVDDDSSDQTWQLALDLLSQYPQLRVMRRTQEKGLSTAVIRGWQVARGEILGVIDADLQHPPLVLLKLIANIEAGADLAVASRHLQGGGFGQWNWFRRFLSKGAQILGLLILPEVLSRLSDPMSGYFLVRRSAIAGIKMSPIGYKILIEVTARGRIRKIAEAGYIFQERHAGVSKVTWRQYLEYLQHLSKLRAAKGVR
ncbi:polyprenol monophosphomannose synthase [Gloeocapsa sp. PCC 73106]|uniref:polyprenol monophosphomannose synthase n=1 Tax=Gloeocapsa sp. PCC 73106 TaxID=102232 RepID=UPI0002AC22B8|nr:glycosyl transferase [Gloeocapsa sp. PCC 73106]